jgi:hypothetical protein
VVEHRIQHPSEEVCLTSIKIKRTKRPAIFFSRLVLQRIGSGKSPKGPGMQIPAEQKRCFLGRHSFSNERCPVKTITGGSASSKAPPRSDEKLRLSF